MLGWHYRLNSTLISKIITEFDSTIKLVLMRSPFFVKNLVKQQIKSNNIKSATSKLMYIEVVIKFKVQYRKSSNVQFKNHVKMQNKVIFLLLHNLNATFQNKRYQIILTTDSIFLKKIKLITNLYY